MEWGSRRPPGPRSCKGSFFNYSKCDTYPRVVVEKFLQNGDGLLVQFVGVSSVRVRRFLSLLPCAALAACGGGSTKPEAPGGTTTIVFRHGKVSGFEQYFQSLLLDFERQNPGLRVRDETMPWDTGQQHQLYAINLEGRSDSFDLFGLDIIWVSEFARAGWIADLSPRFTPAERARFLPSTIEAATWRNKVYAVPFFTDSGLLYYRKDLLDKYGLKVPETWDELAAAARTVLSGEKDPALVGYVWQGKQYEGMICDAVEVLGSNGVRFLDAEGRWAVDDARAAEALRMWTGLVDKKVSPHLVLAADEETARQVFGNGQALFMRNWPYAYGIYSKPTSAVAGKFGIAPLPHFPGHESVGTLGGWFLGVNRWSKHPEAAYKLAAYMTSRPLQEDFFRRLSYLPTRLEVYGDGTMVKEFPQLRDFARILTRTMPRPVTPYYTGVSDIMQGELSAVLADIKPPEKALRNIRIQVEPLLGRAP